MLSKKNKIGPHFDFQIVTESSKNHTDDQETVENFGEIPYLDIMVVNFHTSLLLILFSLRIDEDGEDMFNPGQFVEDMRMFYDPDTAGDDRLFVKPKVSASFNVWDSSNIVLFHRNSPLGKNKV